jgi:hypothetical protein
MDEKNLLISNSFTYGIRKTKSIKIKIIVTIVDPDSKIKTPK